MKRTFSKDLKRGNEACDVIVVLLNIYEEVVGVQVTFFSLHPFFMGLFSSLQVQQ